MRKFSVLFLIFLITTPLLTEERSVPPANQKKINTKINLTCVSNDGTLTQSVAIIEIRLKSKKKLYMGWVNGMSGKASITDASYTIEYKIGPDDDIKVVYSIDRTRAIKNETWFLPNGEIKNFQGTCKKVEPKI